MAKTVSVQTAVEPEHLVIQFTNQTLMFVMTVVNHVAEGQHVMQ